MNSYQHVNTNNEKRNLFPQIRYNFTVLTNLEIKATVLAQGVTLLN